MKRIKIFILLFSIIFLIYPSKKVYALSGSFNELQEAINNCDAGNVLKLEKDYENLGTESQITINKNIVLDLNGHIINGHYINRIFNIESNGNLTIKDSNKTAVHKFDVDEWSLAILNEETGSISVNGGCITGGDVTSGSTNKTRQNGKGSAIYINAGTLTIESGNIIGNKISDKFQFGAGIAAENGATININGGMISYNRTTWEGYGAGIYLNNSNLIMNGGEISYNYGIYGGGINAYDASNVTINGGTISNNIAGHNGGGIALMVLDANVASGVTSKAIINGGVIENNTVVTTLIGVGGGISTNKGADLTINGGTIQKNNANRGAGVGAWNGGTIKIYGGKIIENISVEDTTPSDGSVGNHGGGVFFDTTFINGYSSVDAIVTIGGDAIIKDNNNNVTGKEENVYFADNQKITLASGANAPKSGMNVGITMNTVGTFTTNGSTNDTTYFFSDDTNYEPLYESSSLKLGPKEYTYTFISGDNQKLIQGKIKSYILEIDGDHTLFDSLEIGDLTLINNTDYTITRGSTIITFNTEGLNKLNTLDIDTYDVKVKYTNSKEVLGTLTIQKEIVNPKTADNINYYIIIGCLSVIGLIMSGLYSIKKKIN